MGLFNGMSPAVQNRLQQNVPSIVQAVNPSDSRVYWLGYYNIAGTGYVDGSCIPSVGAATSQFSLSVYDIARNAGPVRLIDTDAIIGSNPADVQTFYLGAGGVNGWPHPNAQGAQAIADHITTYR